MIDRGVEYKDVGGWPGYRVGTDGSFWSCWKRRSLGIGKGTVTFQSELWKRLSTAKSEKGYSVAAAKFSGKTRHKLLHRLILEAFVGVRPAGFECRHLDGDKSNNDIRNICWGTPRENSDDRIRMGRTNKGKSFNAGMNSPHSKLTPTDVQEIISMRSSGQSVRNIAASRSLSVVHVHRICAGNHWSLRSIP